MKFACLPSGRDFDIWISNIKEWLDYPLPPDLLKEIQSYSEIFPLEKIAPKSSEQLKFAEKHEEKDYFSGLGEADGILNKVKLLFSDIFPQKEYMVFN